MSALGERWSIVSLGVSCQTAHQINENVGTLRTLFRDPTLTPATCPIDWLIAPVDSVTGLFRSDVFFPASVDELVLNYRQHWQAANVYFWHDFQGYDPAGEFPAVKQKYQHTTRNLHWVTRSRRTLFVISNTQNNLTWGVADLVGTVGSTVRSSSVLALRAQLQSYFQREFELALVTYRDRYIDDAAQTSFMVECLEPDTTEWQGNPEQWRQVFARIAEKIAPQEP